MREGPLHAARDVLDHEIVDAKGVACGVVDDVEIDGDAGGPLRIVALLTGPGVVAASLARPFAALVRWTCGNARVRIPWGDVANVAERVELRIDAASLGLNASERRLARLISRLPGA